MDVYGNTGGRLVMQIYVTEPRVPILPLDISLAKRRKQPRFCVL